MIIQMMGDPEFCSDTLKNLYLFTGTVHYSSSSLARYGALMKSIDNLCWSFIRAPTSLDMYTSGAIVRYH